MSYQDIAKKYFTTNEERIAKVTDYVKAKGIYENINGYGIYLLRPPYDDYSRHAYFVLYNGDIYNCYVSDSDNGARPVIEITIK